MSRAISADVLDRVGLRGGELDARLRGGRARSTHGDGARHQEAGVRPTVAGPAGAFLADGIVQTFGVEAFRKALSEGPRAFFDAYDRAADQQGKALIPLSKAIQDRLAGTPKP